MPYSAPCMTALAPGCRDWRTLAFFARPGRVYHKPLAGTADGVVSPAPGRVSGTAADHLMAVAIFSPPELAFIWAGRHRLAARDFPTGIWIEGAPVAAGANAHGTCLEQGERHGRAICAAAHREVSRSDRYDWSHTDPAANDDGTDPWTMFPYSKAPVRP